MKFSFCSLQWYRDRPDRETYDTLTEAWQANPDPEVLLHCRLLYEGEVAGIGDLTLARNKTSNIDNAASIEEDTKNRLRMDFEAKYGI